MGKGRTLIVMARHYPAEILRKSAGLARVILIQMKDRTNYGRQGRMIQSLQEKEKLKSNPSCRLGRI